MTTVLASDYSTLQDFFDAAAGQSGHIPAGVYVSDQTLLIHSVTSITSDGPESVIIKAGPGLPVYAPLLQNSGGGGSGISISGVTLSGCDIPGRSCEIASFSAVSGLMVRDCIVRDSSYIGLAVASCQAPRVIGCKFFCCGSAQQSAEQGPALWLNEFNADALISGCYFEGNRWSAIYPHGTRTTVSDCQIVNSGESAVYAGAAPTNRDLKLSNLSISGTTMRNVSGSGIELGVIGAIITGCSISDTAADCISLTDTRDVIISGNVLSNPRRNTLFSKASAIGIYSESANPGNVVIRGNIFKNDGQGYAALAVHSIGGGPVDSVVVEGNSVGQSWSSGRAVSWDHGLWGQGCRHSGNAGSPDRAPVHGEFPSNGAPGDIKVVSGLPFRPSRVEFMATLASPVAAGFSFVDFAAGGTGIYQYIAHDWVTGSNTPSNRVAYIADPTGGAVHDTQFVEFTDDGFSVRFCGAVGAWVHYVAHP